MAEITKALIQSLREMTGVGLMDCKRALVKADGDLQEAVQILRKSGQAKALKKADRVASEGKIAVCVSDDKRSAAIVEINCETDFVAKESHFTEFVSQAARSALMAKTDSLEAVLQSPYVGGEASGTVEETRHALVARLGENITVGRVKYLETEHSFGSYIHHGDKLGVLIEIAADDEALGRRIAMHIAASAPLALDEKDLPAALLEKEKALYEEQAKEAGKPPQVVEKIVSGKLKEFVAGMTLLNQKLVQDPSMRVKEQLEKANAQVFGFVRFAVGEASEPVSKQETTEGAA